MIVLKNLKALREKNNLTQQQMSDIFGIQRPTYSRYENGERQPDFDLLIAISKYFNVSVDYILGRDDYVIKSNPQLSSDEENLIQAYRNHPEMQAAVNKMLDIDNDLETLVKIKQNKPNRETTRYATIAAKGHGPRKMEVTEEQHKAAVEALHELENKK